MLFSVGNLVTLAIVVAMFGAYHLLTADNRSLEKLKRLGDKLKDELGAYVESKGEEIKHYGIDLDVQQKAAKVVLEKIQEAQTTIDEKSESITEIANRFKEYDDILAQLMDMTKRVDQNIAHLAEKNNFIEELTRRVESADKKMAVIEKEMPKVKDQFAHDAKQILDGFRDDILDQLHERLTEIVNMFEKSKVDAQSAIERASSLKEQIDRMTETALEVASDRAHNIEDSAYSTLRTHIAANFDELSRQTEERITALSRNLDELTQSADAKLRALAATTESQVSDTDRRLSEAKAALNAMTADMARIQKETAAASTALSEKFKAERDSLEEQFAQFGQAFETHRASFEKEFLNEISTLRTTLEEAKTHTDDLKTAAEGNISTALATFEESIAQQLESRRAAMDEQIDSWLSSMDAKMRKVSQDALEQRKTEEARLAQEVNAELKRIKDSLYTQAQKIERDIEAFKDV
jgi:chromosome segregation ATPase